MTAFLPIIQSVRITEAKAVVLQFNICPESSGVLSLTAVATPIRSVPDVFTNVYLTDTSEYKSILQVNVGDREVRYTTSPPTTIAGAGTYTATEYAVVSQGATVSLPVASNAVYFHFGETFYNGSGQVDPVGVGSSPTKYTYVVTDSSGVTVAQGLVTVALTSSKTTVTPTPPPSPPPRTSQTSSVSICSANVRYVG